jgi:hypothetical protein
MLEIFWIITKNVSDDELISKEAVILVLGHNLEINGNVRMVGFFGTRYENLFCRSYF